MAPVRPLGLRFTARARSHLQSIQEYIGERNPRAALRVGMDIRLATEILRHFPRAGHAGQAPETLEWVVGGSPYVIVYERIEDDLVILGVFHGAQARE